MAFLCAMHNRLMNALQVPGSTCSRIVDTGPNASGPKNFSAWWKVSWMHDSLLTVLLSLVKRRESAGPLVYLSALFFCPGNGNEYLMLGAALTVYFLVPPDLLRKFCTSCTELKVTSGRMLSMFMT